MTPIVLDSGVLGLVTHPRNSPEPANCKKWFLARLRAGKRFIVPEIADYELRRALLKCDFKTSLVRLDNLNSSVEYLPITTEAMRMAAQYWAEARKRGHPTAADKALDADVILAAQATLARGIVVTTNVRHLKQFVQAKRWRDIS